MSKSKTRQLLPLLAAGLSVLSACSDRSTGPSLAPPTASSVFRSHCEANVRTLTVICATGDSAAVASSFSASRGPAVGPASMTAHFFGGQGVYVNLASSTVTYGGGVFSFNTTIQNVANLSMATSNGTVRDNNGIQVFFNTAPVVTSGSGAITINNATGTATFLTTNQSYYQYGGQIAAIDQPELGADGILTSAEVSSTKNWQFGVPATVLSFAFDVYASTNTAPGAVVTVAPQVSSIAPATLVPGTSATITGTNFNATPASNSVTIGGRAATVTGGTTTSLTITVPCMASGTQPVYVTTGGMRGALFSKVLAVTQRTVALGQALVLTTAASSYCNELTSAGGAARYLVTIFSVDTAPSSNAPFQFSGDNIGAPPAVAAAHIPTPGAGVGIELFKIARDRLVDEQHTQLLEQNAAMYQTLRAKFGTKSSPQISRSIQSRFMPPPLTRTFRVPNLNAGSPSTFCNNYYVVSATLVYSSGKIAIYEDDATPAAFQNASNPTMAANYLAIGNQFNADMEPIISINFGDVLRRDAVLDNNGIIIALFTPRINTSFFGTAGFVVSCDQYPRDDANNPGVGGPYTATPGSVNSSSNFGEVFYADEPTDAGGAGYLGGNTPENWMRSVRSTFIHETKHLAAYAARIANGAPQFEVSWLEEGTARHSEELWMRNAVDIVAWKANTGYGSPSVNVYCDVRTSGACGAGKRPASIMFNHFGALYKYLSDSTALQSPFGKSSFDAGSNFYAISWSLVRYSLDRYGASDAAFLTDLTQATTAGPANLSARAGVSIDQLLGGWGLTLYADDYPGLGSPSADIQFPTWNIRAIFAGLNTDFGTFPYPLVPTPLAFGSSAPLSSAILRGGGLKYFEFSGSQTAAQILRLENSGGGVPSTNLRIAVARLQ